MNMISRRAAAAKEAVEHYPIGDVAEWARRNWTQSVLPYMEEFVSAVKRRSADVPEEYFDETGPLFIFTDLKAMFALAEDMREMPAREKAAVISEVFVPYGDKWQELLAAIQARIGACAETRAFRTKLVQVADTVKLMFVERGLASHVDTVWDLRRGMVEAFAKLRAKVCAANAPARRYWFRTRGWRRFSTCRLPTAWRPSTVRRTPGSPGSSSRTGSSKRRGCRACCRSRGC